jgi:WD40 repeat protein
MDEEELLLNIHSIRSSQEKIDLVEFHPVQPWAAFVDRLSNILVWNYESNEVSISLSPLSPFPFLDTDQRHLSLFLHAQIVYENQLGGADEAALQEATLRYRAAKDTAAATSTAPPELDPSISSKSTASGTVKAIQFLDLDVAFWQANRGISMRHGTSDASAAIPHLGAAPGIVGRRWLIAACENKLVIHDLSSAEAIDIPRSSATDSKAPTSLAMLILNLPTLMGVRPSSTTTTAGSIADDGNPDNPLPSAVEALPVLAVGTNGGSVYLLSPLTGAVFGKLSGGHKGSITAMTVVSGDFPGAPDMLITASTDGTIAIWDPSRSPARGPDREMSPKVSYKAHDGSVNSVALFLAHDDGTPAPPPLRLATVGEDKKIAFWEVGGNAWGKPAAGKMQPLPKTSFHSIAWAPWGSAGLNAHPSVLTATGDTPAIYGLNPTSGELFKYISLHDRIDPGQKKTPKIYQLSVHPTRPDMVAAATNTGVVLLQFDPLERPAVTALPSAVITLEALMAKESAEQQQQMQAGGNNNKKQQPTQPPPRGAPGPTFVTAIGGRLWSTAMRLESKRTAPPPPPPSTQSGKRYPSSSAAAVKLEMSPPELIAELKHPDMRPIISCSSTGRSISVVWPEMRTYTIYTLGPSGTWEPIDGGVGSCIVWSSTTPHYAVLSVPEILAKEVKLEKGLFSKLLFLGPKKQEKEYAERAAAAEATRAAIASSAVSIHAVDEVNATTFALTHNLVMAGGHPVFLHGGALLGLIFVDPVTLERSLQFVSWKDYKSVGESLPEPDWISWEPECTQCALGYASCVQLCKTRPNFERFAALSIPHSQSGLWQSRQLYIVSPTSIQLVFADPITEFVQLVKLASIQGGVNSKTSPPSEATPLPAEQARPSGPLVLAGVRHSYLWLADALGRPFLLSLRHPGLRLRCLAAKGELTTARTIAERGLSAPFHDDVARFLSAMAPVDGIREALSLPGITPAAEMALCVKAGDWNRAAAAFQAHALGASDRTVLDMAYANAPTREVLDPVAAALAEHHTKLMMMEKEDDKVEEEEEEEKEDQDDEDDEEESGSDDDDDDNEEDQVDPINWDAVLAGKPPFTPTLKNEDELDGGATITTTTDYSLYSWARYSDKYGHCQDTTGSSTMRSPRTGGGGGMNNVGRSNKMMAASRSLPPTELARVKQVVELGLRFADQATAAGRMEAARSALGVLVGFANSLPRQLTFELVCRIGQARMTESARNLAAAAATARPGSSLHDPGVAAVLAALAGGYDGGEVVQRTLQAARLAPTSALFAEVYGQGEEEKEMAVANWKDQLGGHVKITSPNY